jgi:hypothetical protein
LGSGGLGNPVSPAFPWHVPRGPRCLPEGPAATGRWWCGTRETAVRCDMWPEGRRLQGTVFGPPAGCSGRAGYDDGWRRVWASASQHSFQAG